MTGIELIVAALAAGAAAGSTEAAQSAVVDGYNGLRDALRHKLAHRSGAGEVLEAHETDPGVWGTRLGRDLAETGADRDERILAAAYRLLALVDPQGVRVGKYTVDLGGAEQLQLGDGTVRIGTSYGPAAGTMTGPVTVSYGERPPVPPAEPEA